MNMTAQSNINSLPSKATLWKASFSATALAAVLFVGVVLPAEYGIDPTGFGKMLGLSALATSSKATPVINTPTDINSRKDTVNLTIPPGGEMEYKLAIAQYGKLHYQWRAEGGDVEFDFHGEPKNDTTGYFESYALSVGKEISGSLTAPFEGSHGWYWKNHGTTPVTINLTMAGVYNIIGVK